MQTGYDINDLVREAQTRWLKGPEVLFILQNYEKIQFTEEPPKQPTSGSLFLFNKRVLKFFRRDGHSWRKKKDGRTIGEAHERLKVGNVEALNCYYAHGEDNSNFQRRSYWRLDPAFEHIVLVHYRDITEGKPCPRSAAVLSSGSSLSFSRSPSLSTNQNLGSISISDHVPSQNLTSPASIEVSSATVKKKNRKDHFDRVDRTGDLGHSTELEVSQALRRLEKQLSLNDDSFKDLGPVCSLDEGPNDADLLDYERKISNGEQFAEFCGQEQNLWNQLSSGIRGDCGHNHECSHGGKESLIWKEALDSCKMSEVQNQEKHTYILNSNEEKSLPSSRHQATKVQEHHQWMTYNINDVEKLSLFWPEGSSLEPSPDSSVIENPDTNADYYTMLLDQRQIGSLESEISLIVPQKQKFTIQEISPEWGYANEATKIVIVGCFLCDSSESKWHCMFGNVEVPVQIIQNGVIRCEAPPHPPGKATLCVTSGNRESCSEVREFEYRAKSNNSADRYSSPTGFTESPEELLLLVRFVQMLLSDSSVLEKDIKGADKPRILKAKDDMWDNLIEALLVDGGTSSNTINWLLEELLKDKLKQWIFSRSLERNDKTACSLSNKEQVMIHMIAGLGFEWALNPILSSGVGINFRDLKGWTALHWAARFGREKMVAALVAYGASAGAVTDPTSHDLVGKNPASIAASSGHKGLAGYLSELALTSHLKSLTLEESELSRGSAVIEAEKTVDSISKQSFASNEDQLSFKDTLAAVRNAAQAAARIQAAFRAHSFRKRQQREDYASSVDEYGISSEDIQGILAMHKLTFRNPRDYNSAAMSIQKKYKGWKGRKDYLAFRQKVVKIQAHVRGYQVRKHYKAFCWAVGVLEKAVIRWRRKGVGLRGFRPETYSIDESEDEDILKVFRKQKVDVAVEEAVSRVLSMIGSSEARHQYHRILERYRQAKAELGDEEAISTNPADLPRMEATDVHQFP